MVTTADKGEVSKRVIESNEESKTASVFVGNLAYKTNWQSLKDYMGQVGIVTHASVFKDETGRSKGCGLVEFKNKSDAEKAIAELDNTVLDGRSISVRPDERGDTREPRKPREFDSKRVDSRQNGGRGGFKSFGGDRPQRDFDRPKRDFGGDRPQRDFGGERPQRPERKTDGSEVFVSNLSWELSWQDLKDAFKAYGTVLRADIVKDRKTGRSAGYGFVTFESPAEAEEAIEKMNGVTLKGRDINVKTSTKKADF